MTSSVVSDSLRPPWTTQSVEFSRPEYWSGIFLLQRSSQPRDWTQVSCIAGGFFTGWATREAQYKSQLISRPKRKPEDNGAFYFEHKVDFLFPTFLMKKTWVCGFWQASSLIFLYCCSVFNFTGISSLWFHYLCLLWVYFAFHLDF